MRLSRILKSTLENETERHEALCEKKKLQSKIPVIKQKRSGWQTKMRENSDG